MPDAAGMARCVDIIKKAADADRTMVVVSAVSGCTGTLIRIGNMAAVRDTGYKRLIDALQSQHNSIARQLLPFEKQKETEDELGRIFDYLRGIAQGVCLLGELSDASLEAIQGCGELLSTKIIASKLISLGCAALWVDSRDIIKTYKEKGKNVVDSDMTCSNVRRLLSSNPSKNLFVLPGSVASDKRSGRTTTLGSCGTDYSAALFAVGSQARALETWKETPGIMTADPEVVPDARQIASISYRAARELSHFKAKTIFPPTFQPAVDARIPIYVRCTASPDDRGTLIEANPVAGRTELVGISASDGIALLSMEGSGMVDIPGFSGRLFKALSDNDINIILITQASSVNTMCVAVSQGDAWRAKEAADRGFAYEISIGTVAPLSVETGFCVLSLVGSEDVNRGGVTGRMLAAIGSHGISVRAVAQGSSERNVSVIVSEEDVTAATRCIHREFFGSERYVDIHLFVAEYGQIGKAFLDTLAANVSAIAQRTGRRLSLVGLYDGERYLIDPDGIDPAKAPSLLEMGKEGNFFDEIGGMAMSNSVFVDCTYNSDIAYNYRSLLRQGYNVVTTNKIPFAMDFAQYLDLKESAAQSGVTLRYGTAVGAVAPVLEFISRSVNAGDRISRIEAVLSGTDNYILSSYKGGRDGHSFADAVREAVKAGYNDDDFRVDLSGRDAMRKLLILAREAGIPLEEKDVELTPLISPEVLALRGEEFYTALEEREAQFAAKFEEAASKGEALRYVALLEGGKARIGLRSVPVGNPFHELGGTDNVVLLTTEFFPSALAVRGACADARQIAAGILNDILL